MSDHLVLGYKVSDVRGPSILICEENSYWHGHIRRWTSATEFTECEVYAPSQTLCMKLALAVFFQRE